MGKGKKILVIILTLSIVITSGLSTSSFAYENLNTSEEVYDKSIQLDLIELKKDGTIEYLGKQEDLNINNDLYNNFLERIYNINFLINKGLAFIDKSTFQVEALSPEETMIVSSNSTSNNLEEYIVNSMNPKGLPDEYPTIDLRGLVRDNRRELEDIAEAYLDVFPTTAVLHTTYWWIGKVNKGKDWDYKSKPGFSPYDRKFTATTFNGTKVVTSEYIGNYNYGFTGEMLFPLSILYTGGEFAAGHIFIPEDMDDRAAIKNGYDDANNFW